MDLLCTDAIEAFKEAFDHFDRDGSGLISELELETVLAEFGQRPTKCEMRGMIEEVDRDHNGEIDFDEFLTMMNKYAAKASKVSELHAPDAPFIVDALTQRIGLTKRELLEQVRTTLEGEVAGTAERALRTDSGKDFFRAEMKKGTAFVVSQLGRSFDELQRSVAGILELKDRKQADGIVASRAQSFVQAAAAVMAAKATAREDTRLLQAQACKARDALVQRAQDELRAADATSQGQVSRLSMKLDRTERARGEEEVARVARERDVSLLETALAPGWSTASGRQRQPPRPRRWSARARSCRRAQAARARAARGRSARARRCDRRSRIWTPRPSWTQAQSPR
jgi:hypothetical protein